jgi:hypothetical protein
MPFSRRRRVDLYLSAAAARRLISVGGARFSAAAARHPETPDPISHFLFSIFFYSFTSISRGADRGGLGGLSPAKLKVSPPQTSLSVALPKKVHN